MSEEAIYRKKFSDTKIGKKLTSDKASTVILLLPYVILFTLFIIIPVVIAIGLSFTYFNLILIKIYNKLI